MKRIIWIALGCLMLVPAQIFASGLEKDNSKLDARHIPQEIHRLHVKDDINAVAWNADGSRLAALSGFGSTVTLWETKTWTVLKEFRRYGGAYSQNSLSFLPDGTLLTAAPGGDYSQDPRYANTTLTDARYNTLEIFSLIQWNVDTGKPVHYLPDLGYPPKDLSKKITNTFAVSPDGSLVAGIHGDVLLYDVKRGSLLRSITIPPFPKHKDVAVSVAFSPNGQVLAIGTMFGWLRFYNVNDGVPSHSILAYPTEEYSCGALAYSPDGQQIAIGKHKNINVREPNDISTTVWRVSDGALVASFTGSMQKIGGVPEATPVRTLDWSPLGDVIAVGDDGSLRLWRVDNPTNTPLLDIETPGTYSIKYTSQGALAASHKNEVVIYK
jgi:WD40 repeat protein